MKASSESRSSGGDHGWGMGSSIDHVMSESSRNGISSDHAMLENSLVITTITTMTSITAAVNAYEDAWN